MSGDSDALKDYLSVPPVSSACDPTAWWASLGADNALARMALDFLSTPAASTDVERAFSRGGLIVSCLRHALSDESTCATTVLSS